MMGVRGQSAKMRIGHRHIERIANDIDRCKRHIEIDGRKALNISNGIMGLDIDRAVLASYHFGVYMHPRFGDFFGRCLLRGLSQPARESFRQRFPFGHFMKSVDVLRCFTLPAHFAQEIMNEDANPGIAGFGIGGDPDSALPLGTGIFARPNLRLSTRYVWQFHGYSPAGTRPVLRARDLVKSKVYGLRNLAAGVIACSVYRGFP